MSKIRTPFFDDPQWPNIVDNVKGIFFSDGIITTLLDFERVLDEADLYSYQHWNLGELVDGPVTERYTVTCTFMYPASRMPNPAGAKRIINLGCKVFFKKTKIIVPVVVKTPMDFVPGTHYPKMTQRPIWLVQITMPKQLMNNIREGSIDLADQTIDLEDLQDAYAQDLDKNDRDDNEKNKGNGVGLAMPGGLAPPPSLGF